MREWKILVFHNPVFSKCPDCHSAVSLKKSRPRNLKEKIIKNITFFRNYRCDKCGWRGYKSILTFSHDSFNAILLYAGIIIIVVIVVRFVLSKFLG